MIYHLLFGTYTGNNHRHGGVTQAEPQRRGANAPVELIEKSQLAGTGKKPLPVTVGQVMAVLIGRKNRVLFQVRRLQEAGG